jgi:hypothetical protein
VTWLAVFAVMVAVPVCLRARRDRLARRASEARVDAQIARIGAYRA